jgi:hypothetical protein
MRQLEKGGGVIGRRRWLKCGTIVQKWLIKDMGES